MADNFIEISKGIENLDRVIVRTLIKSAIDSNLSIFQGKMIDIGCGKMPYKKYILENSQLKHYDGLDIASAIVYDIQVRPDYEWDGVTMPFGNELYDCAVATEVLEHCPDPEIILKETYRILKPGGKMFFTVPFLWNLHETPQDQYRYTPFSLKRHFENSGFHVLEMKATGGWHASLAMMLGLWVRRSPMSKRRKNFLSYFIRPIMFMLFKKDKKDVIKFTEGQMITGLYGVIQKPLAS